MGFFVYQYAKLQMLSFYYDLVDRYVDRKDFCILEMDTGKFVKARTQVCVYANKLDFVTNTHFYAH